MIKMILGSESDSDFGSDSEGNVAVDSDVEREANRERATSEISKVSYYRCL